MVQKVLETLAFQFFSCTLQSVPNVIVEKLLLLEYPVIAALPSVGTLEVLSRHSAF